MSLWGKAGLAVVALCLFLWSAGPRLGADDAKKVDLKVGDAAPTFESTDDQGKEWKSSDHVGKKILVVYFYPGDLTRGCTMQACSFRDDMKKLADKGVEVVGVSGDSVKSHQLFKKKEKLNFTLLADEDGSVAKKFGVPFRKGGSSKVVGPDNKEIELKRGATITRWTFVIGQDGKILYKNTKVKPAQDSKEILKLVKKLET
jgi:thioredoxin-dependent peroxiredoxin